MDEYRSQLESFQREIPHLSRIIVEISEGCWLDSEAIVDCPVPVDCSVSDAFKYVCEDVKPTLIDAAVIDGLPTIGGNGLYLEIAPDEFFVMPATYAPHRPLFEYRHPLPSNFIQWGKLYWAEEAEIPRAFAVLAKTDPELALSILEHDLVLPGACRESVRQIRTYLSNDAIMPLLTNKHRKIRERAILILNRVDLTFRPRRSR